MSSWNTDKQIDYDILTYGFFCTPCLFGENAHSVTKHPSCVAYALSYSVLILSAQVTGVIISSIVMPQNVLLPSVLGAVLANAVIGHYAGNMRRQIRDKYNIEGSAFEDFCIHFCCSPCGVCQEAHEIRYQSNTNILDDIDDSCYESAPLVQQVPMIPKMEK